MLSGIVRNGCPTSSGTRSVAWSVSNTESSKISESSPGTADGFVMSFVAPSFSFSSHFPSEGSRFPSFLQWSWVHLVNGFCHHLRVDFLSSFPQGDQEAVLRKPVDQARQAARGSRYGLHGIRKEELRRAP